MHVLRYYISEAFTYYSEDFSGLTGVDVGADWSGVLEETYYSELWILDTVDEIDVRSRDHACDVWGFSLPPSRD